jgi:hypothetical protein
MMTVATDQPEAEPQNIVNWTELTGRELVPGINHSVSVSGGVPSGVVGHLVAKQFGESASFVFADTLGEDFDLYRFLVEISAVSFGLSLADVSDLAEAARKLPPLRYGKEKVRYAEIKKIRVEAMRRMPRLNWLMQGRDVWQVFNDVQFIGNHLVDPCSKQLKRDQIDYFRDWEYAGTKTVVYLGIDWMEAHRLINFAKRVEKYVVCAPLVDLPLVNLKDGKAGLFQYVRDLGIEPPRIYATGAAHNNCHLFCVKSGQAQFALLLRHFPEVYDFHEQKEQEWREKHGRDDIAIIRRRRNNVTEYMTLRQFRIELQAGLIKVDKYDIGGCGCAID